MSAKSILKTKPTPMQTAVKTAPLLPGCYIYRNAKAKILYIGKAKILRNRVRSYFNNYNRVEEKIRQMIDQAESIEFLITDSEIEALILESNLIKKYKPKYNSLMVDDKSYAYVKFDKVKTSNGKLVPMPTITITREKLADGADYFGPYPNSGAVKRLITRLRKVFPFCSSKAKVIIPASRDQFFQSNQLKPCFHYGINLCNGVCAGLATRGEYEHNINAIKQFFQGEKSKLQHDFEVTMKSAAKQHNYEEAARYRNMINDIKYAGSNLHIDRDIDEISVMKAKMEKKLRGQADLVTRLEFPGEKLKTREGFRIECYDISNIQGTNAVGSMVVAIDGQPSPDNYRRFKIRMKNEPNDFAMMQEVLTRRFGQYLKAQQANNHDLYDEHSQHDRITEVVDNEGFTIEIPKELHAKLKNWKPDPSFSQLPDLIIIDGGKGQLSSAYKILKSYGLAEQVPIVGLAKREEEIFKVGEQFKPANEIEWPQVLHAPHVPLKRTPVDQIEEFQRILLPRKSEALYIVQRIRDEAHRFAITYHRKLRSKSALLTSS